MNNEIYKQHLLTGLKAINDEYEYIIEWDSFFLNQENQNPLKAGKKRLLILLTEMPSVVYGDGDMTLSVMVEIFSNQENTREVFDILKQYQINKFNQKEFINNVMITENYYSPSIAENYVKIDNVYKVRILMQGTCSFTKNVVSIKEIKFNNEKVKYLLFHDGLVAENTATTLINNFTKKTTNNAGLYTLEMKLINTSNTICSLARQWKNGQLNGNYLITTKVTYTDNSNKTFNMVFTSVDYQEEQNGNIPTIVIQLRERVNL